MHSRRFRLLSVIAFLLPVSASGSGGGSDLLKTVPDVVQSTDYTCGCSALEAVFAHWGVEFGEMKIAKAAKVDPEVGAEMEDLVKVAKSKGLVASIRQKFTLKELYREVKRGRPVIALIQAWKTDPKLAWKDAWDDGHYVVVIGMDRRNVIVEDPSLEDARGSIPHKEFVERWHCWTIDGRKMTGQAILIRPRSKTRRAPHKRGRKYPTRIEPVK